MSEATILCGDALAVLRTLPSESVHCCVTSPPYWGLRDYGTARWGGGDAGCSHEPPQEWTEQKFNAHHALDGSTGTQSAAAKCRWYNEDGSCPACGARRIDDQIGLERTPEEYIGRLVEVFREVRRVLRGDGTLWLNLGDSYASSPPGNSTTGVSAKSTLHGVNDASAAYRETLEAGHAQKRNTIVGGLKPKDLVGIPWRVALALQADGWWLRQDIIWSKPNPMPESVTDRCTKSHEYVFLLSKSGRYNYDADAVKEKGVSERSGNLSRKDATGRGCPASGVDGNVPWSGADRNRRDVWTIPTQPFPEAHFAVMPEALARTCILAGCPAGGVVLDPFGGAGTTAKVAQDLGCDSVLIELNPKYRAIAVKRLAQQLLPFEASHV